MNVRRWVAVGASAALVTAGVVMAGATPASAADTDQIWYQAIGSPSQEAPCPESDPADLSKGWTKWVKGYEMWPNDGKGGWTCGRSILWAKGSPPPSSSFPSAGCVQGSSAEWVDFLGGFSLPYGSPVYYNPACSTIPGSAGYSIVYAPDGAAQADDLCQAAFGTLAVLNFGYSVWACG